MAEKGKQRRTSGLGILLLLVPILSAFAFYGGVLFEREDSVVPPRLAKFWRNYGLPAMRPWEPIKIYGSRKWPNTQRVLLLLEEKELPYTLEEVDVDKNETKTKEFLSLQPFGQTPVIEDGNIRLFESRAILRYLASRYRGIGVDVLGETEEEQAAIDMWMEVEAHEFAPSALALFKEALKGRRGQEEDDDVLDQAQEVLEMVMLAYDKHLKRHKQKYLATNSYSLADIVHVPLMDALMQAKFDDVLAVAGMHASKWWERLEKRKAWKRAKGKKISWP